MGFVITIDGPAASGKTSVSRELAHRLHCEWVSTGAFYRGLAFAAKELNVDLQDEKALGDLTISEAWKVVMNTQRTQVHFGNKDVTDLIAQEEVGFIASKISHYPKVRQGLLLPQRACQNTAIGLVAEGRDCGTVIFPNADMKFYLTARSENRAQRRAQELGLDEQETAEAQKIRDNQDSTRKAAPLQVPENAMVIDTTELGLNEVVDLIEKQVRLKLKK